MTNAPVSFIPFELERWQSTWDYRTRFNLSESGVHPLSIGELLEITDTDPKALLDLRMEYSQTNGTDALRAAIAALYTGATPDNVLVTVGSSEANFISSWTLIEPGDLVTIQVPTYMQTWGLAKNFGADVTTFSLKEEQGWAPEPDEIRDAIRPGTRLVVVTNPNNPTGHVLATASRQAILQRVHEVGAWLLVDEVYQGAERNGNTTRSFWSENVERDGPSYDRIIVTGSLSKAYGLPGLRIGWIVAPKEFIGDVVRRHDYTVIGPSAVGDYLGIRALGERERILARTRAILNENYATLAAWFDGFGDLLVWKAPDAGALCYARYRLGIDSLDLVARGQAEHDVLLVPGAHFDMSNYIRIGYGGERHNLVASLDALGACLRDLVAD